MKRTHHGLALAAVLIVAAASGFASGKGGQGAARFPDGLPDMYKRGCRDGGFKNQNRVNPSWVSVDANDAPEVAEGVVRVSQVTYEDFPNCHESHDWNVYIKLDPQYEFLNSPVNRKYNAQGKPDPNGDYVIEMEWETKQFPNEFLPIFGDRVWTIGRWVYDCGHPAKSGDRMISRSEIHPPKGVAFTREEPHVFQGDSQPTNANKVFVYFNAQGGYFYDPVGLQSFEFDVPMPPRPSSTAVPRYEIIRMPFGGPTPQVIVPQQPAVSTPASKPNPEAVKRLEERMKQKLESGELPERPGRTRPEEAERINLRRQELLDSQRRGRSLAGMPTARIKYDLSRESDRPRWNQYAAKWTNRNPGGTPVWVSDPPRPANSKQFGAILALGWKEQHTVRPYRVYRVTFDRIKIINDHDSPFSGEWNLWLQANGNWFKVPGLGDVDDGDTVQIGKMILLTVPDAGGGDPGGTIQVQATGWESDSIDDDFKITSPTHMPLSLAGDLTGHINTPLGVINRRINVQSAAGLYQEQAVGGDYRLDYRIEEVKRIPAMTPHAAAPATRKVTVTFLSVKLLKQGPKTILGNPGMWLDFEVNSRKLRFPQSGLAKLNSGQTAFLNLAAGPFTLGPAHTLQIGVKGKQPLLTLGEVNRLYNQALDFGAGTYTETSTTQSGQFQLTYRIDVQ